MHTIAVPAQASLAPPGEPQRLALWPRAKATARARRRSHDAVGVAVVGPVPCVEAAPAATPWCHGCGASDDVVACDRCHASACREHAVCLPDRRTVCVGCALVASGVRLKGRRPHAATRRAWLRT